MDPTQIAVEGTGDEAPYNAPASVFDSASHCLHGVLHGNGYGHLVRSPAQLSSADAGQGRAGAGHGGRRALLPMHRTPPRPRAPLRTAAASGRELRALAAGQRGQELTPRAAAARVCCTRGPQLRVNGRDGACGPLNGKQLVGLWDALCGLLCAQEVSVEDVSNKSGMLLRLLHVAAHRKTW